MFCHQCLMNLPDDEFASGDSKRCNTCEYIGEIEILNEY